MAILHKLWYSIMKKYHYFLCHALLLPRRIEKLNTIISAWFFRQVIGFMLFFAHIPFQKGKKAFFCPPQPNYVNNITRAFIGQPIFGLNSW